MPYPRSSIPPLEAFPALDVRRLAREGKLQVGRTSEVVWTCDGKPCAGVRLTADDDAVHLAFRTTDGVLVEQRVPLTFTAQRLGRRVWFTCDAVVDGQHCGRRCAVLYVASSPVFACRRCHGLSYVAQREPRSLRGLQAARKIRASLGGGPSLYDPLPRRPANMRREVYVALRAKYNARLRRLGLR